MGELFGSIYCWFEEFFGIELANYSFNILLCNQSPSLEPLVGMGDFPYGKCSNKLYCGLAIGA